MKVALNVSPNPAGDNCAHISSTHFELLANIGYRFTISGFPSYCQNIGFRKFASAMTRAFCLSPFAYHVSKIFGPSAGKQVRRIDTFPYVTFMANVHSFRDGADTQNVCKSMRQPAHSRFAKHNLSVSEHLARSPRPTFIPASDANFAPKPINFMFSH